MERIPRKSGFPVSSRRDQPVAHSAQKSPLVDAIVDLAQAPGAGRQVDRRRSPDDSRNQARSVAKLPGQFQHHIAAERESGHVGRRSPLLPQLSEERPKVGSEAPVIQRRTEVSRSAAGAHVKPVDRKARFKGRLREAHHVARFAGAFEAMHQNDLAPRPTPGPLRLHQHLYAGLGRIELRFHRIPPGIEPPGPEVSHDRERVIVGYDRTERAQALHFSPKRLAPPGARERTPGSWFPSPAQSTPRFRPGALARFPEQRQGRDRVR